jgi:3-hydroxyacyl-CoA dehydrogenase/enoyl-CoA hydratase/3-hydroxybutyryl-CoA epimerase
MANWTYDVDADGIALLTIDMPGRSMNVFDEDSSRELAELVERLLADGAVRGAVVASGKPAFIAGADLEMLARINAELDALPEAARAAAAYHRFWPIQAMFRRIETGGKPFAAAVGGTAMGGGFELALACHRRIVADDPAIRVGLPEAKVGLLPGGGGTQRLARMIGAEKALPLLLEGRALAPEAALKAGIVDEVVPRADLLGRARAWVREATPAQAVKPWDAKSFRMPGPDARTHHGGGQFAVANALQRRRTHGNYPAADAIQQLVYQATIVPMDVGLRLESKYFGRLVAGPVARNMIRTGFVGVQRAAKQRLPGFEKRRFARIGVLGAGMMGAGIAHVAARAGIDVVLIDRDLATAEAAIARVTDEVARARITATLDYAALADADLVIEAVFEDRALKAEVTARACAVLRPDAIFASNTSTLPITGLAEAATDPARFIGLHFFSPVEKMPLLEVIRGARTSEATIAASLDFARVIGKTPVVVSDSRGFYTSRVFATYTREGMLMLAEGVAPALIENAGRATGMPVPPLSLSDEVALDLIQRIGAQTRRDSGDTSPLRPDEALIDRLVAAGRTGKKARRGFYDYPQDGPKRLWPGLADLAPVAAMQPEFGTLKSRLLAIQALEAARCLEEGVVATPADADVAALLGWGFAPWTGGPLSFIDTMGAAAFVALCDGFAQAHGARFAPTPALRTMAAEGSRFYADATRAAA